MVLKSNLIIASIQLSTFTANDLFSHELITKLNMNISDISMAFNSLVHDDVIKFNRMSYDYVSMFNVTGDSVKLIDIIKNNYSNQFITTMVYNLYNNSK
jgi:hypothetical protein